MVIESERRTQNAERRTKKRAIIFFILSSAFCVLRSWANDLNVDPKHLQLNHLATITVSLEGTFASAETVNVPVENLALLGEPAVSTEFAWINGTVTRRKTFRFRARPLLPGVARVGPMVLIASDGQRDTLPAVAIEVIADRISVSNDPETLLRELIATGRPPLFLVAEADKREAWTGEQILVTWYLYNGATVQNWQIVSVPKLPDFWSEELDRQAGEAERVYVGDTMMQRVPLRRVGLYPLRSGSLSIGGMAVEAAVMERVRSGPFAMFEGNLVETTFTSAPVAINVKPLPPGPPVAAVGEIDLRCDTPQQRKQGPVVIEATLTGAANLRGAPTPVFAGPIAGNVQVEGGAASVLREGSAVAMSRRWRYLIFPSKSGMLEIPPLTSTVFSPSTGQRRDLRCEAATLWSTAVPAADAPASRRRDAAGSAGQRLAFRWIVPLLALGLAVLFTPRVLRELAIRREVREIVASGDIRARIDARLGRNPAVLLAERSERGDAYRALRSLLDAIERDRDIATDAGGELARRVRDVLTIAT